jgi:hypothetical protein
VTRLPSVTTVLAQYSNFDFVKPEVLEAACDRGDLFHSLMFRHATGLIIFPEDPKPIQGYFDSGRRWFDKHVLQVHAAEVELKDELRGVIGHPDLICTLIGDQGRSLWDYKTGGAYLPTHPLQLGGYYGLANKEGHDIKRVGTVHPRKNGKMPLLRESTSTMNHDYSLFICALNLYKYFQKGA